MDPVSWAMPEAVADADLVHIHQAYTRQAEVAIVLAKVYGKPVCVTDHGGASSRIGVEFGTHKGLDWIKGKVVILDPSDTTLRIPQMGWNELNVAARHPALESLRPGDHGYFVHSYHFVADRPADVLATVEYGGPVAAIIGRDNLLGVQFHPEKSQSVGLDLLARFLSWNP